MDVEILRQLDQGLLALDRGYSDLSLEGRAVVLARSSRHGHLLARGSHAPMARKIHLSRLFSFSEPPLMTVSVAVPSQGGRGHHGAGGDLQAHA
jgi:hypothetical protein